ncbi:MAG: radical SAM protein [Candidatus Woesearchaeota archaeon]
MKIQLIRPPLDSWYKSSQLTEFVSVPTGLCMVAGSNTSLLTDVTIFDGFNTTLEETLDRVDGDWVGVSDIYPSHNNALAILKKAKEKGAITFIGGPNVNYLAERILKNHDYVDLAVVGDGDRFLFDFFQSKTLHYLVPNLVYRTPDRIRRNKRVYFPLDRTFDLDAIENLSDDMLNNIPISFIRGCVKAEEKGRCTFCTMDEKLRVMDPDLAWKQIDLLNRKYGTTSFTESGDSFIVRDYPDQLLAARPGHLGHITFGRVYSSPDQINTDIVQTLKDLNVGLVFVGIESVDDDILERARKGYGYDDVRRAIDLLYNAEVPVHVPFIYGLEGETPVTMEKTYEFARSLIGQSSAIIFISSAAVPIPGSMLFENIRFDEQAGQEYPGDLDNDDIFDYQALVRLQCKYFTDVTYDEVMGAVRETKALIKESGRSTSFGINE